VRDSGGSGFQISTLLAHEGNKVVSPTQRPPLPPRKYSWYSFLLEAESTPETECGRKDYVNEKFQWHHRDSNPRPSAVSLISFSQLHLILYKSESTFLGPFCYSSFTCSASSEKPIQYKQIMGWKILQICLRNIIFVSWFKFLEDFSYQLPLRFAVKVYNIHLINATPLLYIALNYIPCSRLGF
jgi:hypothetical protein